MYIHSIAGLVVMCVAEYVIAGSKSQVDKRMTSRFKAMHYGSSNRKKSLTREIEGAHLRGGRWSKRAVT